MQRSPKVPWLLVLACIVALGCRREKTRPERTEPWPAPAVSSQSAPSHAPVMARYRVEQSDVTFELPAKQATPRGRLGGGTGAFDVNLAKPVETRGSLRFDLALLKLDPDAAEPKGTRRALEWLGLGSEVAEAERERRRFATFTLRSLEGPDGVSLSKPPKRRDGRHPTVEYLATGELALLGVRAPVRVLVAVEIAAPEAPGGAPERLVIRSRRPLVVSLAVHDIRPRNARGVLLARELGLLGESVGREAKVSFELVLSRER